MFHRFYAQSLWNGPTKKVLRSNCLITKLRWKLQQQHHQHHRCHWWSWGWSWCWWWQWQWQWQQWTQQASAPPSSESPQRSNINNINIPRSHHDCGYDVSVPLEVQMMALRRPPSVHRSQCSSPLVLLLLLLILFLLTKRNNKRSKTVEQIKNKQGISFIHPITSPEEIKQPTYVDLTWRRRQQSHLQRSKNKTKVLQYTVSKSIDQWWFVKCLQETGDKLDRHEWILCRKPNRLSMSFTNF